MLEPAGLSGVRPERQVGNITRKIDGSGGGNNGGGALKTESTFVPFG